MMGERLETASDSTPQVGEQVGAQSGSESVAPEVAPEVLRLLAALNGEMDRVSLQDCLRLKAEKNFRLLYLQPALRAGLIERTIPDKPRSSKQKYHLTATGKRLTDKEGTGHGE